MLGGDGTRGGGRAVEGPKTGRSQLKAWGDGAGAAAGDGACATGGDGASDGAGTTVGDGADSGVGAAWWTAEGPDPHAGVATARR